MRNSTDIAAAPATPHAVAMPSRIDSPAASSSQGTTRLTATTCEEREWQRRDDEPVLHEVATHPYYVGEPQPQRHGKHYDDAPVQAAFPGEPSTNRNALDGQVERVRLHERPDIAHTFPREPRGDRGWGMNFRFEI